MPRSTTLPVFSKTNKAKAKITAGFNCPLTTTCYSQSPSPPYHKFLGTSGVTLDPANRRNSARRNETTNDNVNVIKLTVQAYRPA